jgi:hypothetical protein
MRVRVGPLPSAGVGLWIAYARTVIGRAVARPDELGTRLDPSDLEAFDGFLDAWELASTDPVFEWESDLDPQVVARLGGTWLSLAAALSDQAEARGYPLSPPEGEEFYQALIRGFLTALDGEGGDMARLAADLRDAWPGLKPPDAP